MAILSNRPGCVEGRRNGPLGVMQLQHAQPQTICAMFQSLPWTCENRQVKLKCRKNQPQPRKYRRRKKSQLLKNLLTTIIVACYESVPLMGQEQRSTRSVFMMMMPNRLANFTLSAQPSIHPFSLTVQPRHIASHPSARSFCDCRGNDCLGQMNLHSTPTVSFRFIRWAWCVD